MGGGCLFCSIPSRYSLFHLSGSVQALFPVNLEIKKRQFVFWNVCNMSTTAFSFAGFCTPSVRLKRSGILQRIPSDVTRRKGLR